MSLKSHSLLVSLSVAKPQLTRIDRKATADAENLNDAHGAGKYRLDLYPKHLIAPIVQVESSARAYIEHTTYVWSRGEYVLPMPRFMDFTQRIGKYELEFDQAVTAFLNNWSNVMQQAQQRQGALFDASVYPDLSDLRAGFRFRVNYRPITDATDFRVQCQEEEMDLLRAQVEEATKESLNAMMQAPLKRLRDVVAKLNEVAGKTDRMVLNARTGAQEQRPPIFRDSVVDNIMEEINLLHDFAEVLPPEVLSLAKQVADTTPHPQSLRDDHLMRKATKVNTARLLAAIDNMLDD